MNADPVSLSSLTFSIAGAGKVGSSLAYWLTSQGCQLSQVASRSLDSAADLADSLGGRSTALSELSTAGEDLLILAVSDLALEEVAALLSDRSQAAVVLHTAGRFTSEVLVKLRHTGTSIGSLHPLKAFPRVLSDPAEANGTFFGVDGDPLALETAETIAKALGGKAIVVPAPARNQYHLAATIAAGGVVTLLATTAEVVALAGLDSQVMNGYFELARGALGHARDSDSISTAITGPLARGETQAYQRQIEEIRLKSPELAVFLEFLAKRTLYHSRDPEIEDPELLRT